MPKKKYNGFYYFMKEMQETEKSKGNNISMNNMPTIAHPLWKELSVAQKEPYERMAKERKNDPGNYAKLASDGTKVEDNLREIEEEEKRERKMILDVKNLCNVNCSTYEGNSFKESAPKKIFYVLSFNILCRTEEDIYIPNEVGLVEYSIEHGILREYHNFFNPGSIPKGYTGEARRHSEDTHRIPYTGLDFAVKDPNVILNEIKEFINPQKDEEYPPVFCASQAIDLTQGCLHWLATQSRCYYDRNLLKVLKITYLLMELRAGVKEALPSFNFAEDLLTKNAFDYHPSSRCNYHEDLDVPHCALGYSKRLCYLLSDAVCGCFDVILTEKHIPNRALERKDYEIFATSKPQNAYPVSAGRGWGRGKPIVPSFGQDPNRQIGSADSLDRDILVRNVRIPINEMNDLPSHPVIRGTTVQSFYTPPTQPGLQFDDEEFPSLSSRRPTASYDEDEPRQPESLYQHLESLGITGKGRRRGK